MEEGNNWGRSTSVVRHVPQLRLVLSAQLGLRCGCGVCCVARETALEFTCSKRLTVWVLSNVAPLSITHCEFQCGLCLLCQRFRCPLRVPKNDWEFQRRMSVYKAYYNIHPVRLWACCIQAQQHIRQRVQHNGAGLVGELEYNT